MQTVYHKKYKTDKDGKCAYVYSVCMDAYVNVCMHVAWEDLVADWSELSACNACSRGLSVHSNGHCSVHCTKSTQVVSVHCISPSTGVSQCHI